MEPFNRDSMLFGNGIQGQINSYAASFGTVKPGDRHPQYVINGLGNMRHISVRDKKSAKIVEDILGYAPPVVLDPTWLWDFTSDRNIVDPQDENYILVYGQDFAESFIENLIQFAKSEHKRIVALDCNQDRYNWCDKLIRQSELSPFEWIGYFKNADYIATSTFHGLTFSLIFQKKFAFCKTDFILAKADAFLDELNILPYFEDREDVQYMLTRDWDYSYINKIIDEKRRQSFRFLEAAIGE